MASEGDPLFLQVKEARIKTGKDHAVMDRAVKKGTLKAEFEEDQG